MIELRQLTCQTRSPLNASRPLANMLGRLGLALALCCLTVETSRADAVKTAAGCPMATGDEKTVSTVIRTATDTERLTFPWSYLVPLGFEDGGERDAVTFMVDNKTFSPLGGDALRQSHKDDPQHKAIILVSVILSEKRSSALEELGRLSLLINNLAQRPDVGASSVEGLLQPLAPSAPRDLFFSHVPTLPTDVIHCSKVGSVPFPWCNHVTKQDGLLVSASYPRSRLMDWREMRAKTLHLVRCFTEAADDR